MSDSLAEFVEGALRSMNRGPQALAPAVAFAARQAGKSVKRPEEAIVARLTAGANDDVRRALHDGLAAWDWESQPEWAAGTQPNTRARRDRIHALLKTSAKAKRVIDATLEYCERTEGTIVDEEDAVQGWYTAAFRSRHDFYWPKLKTFLRSKGFERDAVNALDVATTKVIERLGDPSARATRAARGLVVGHVQSGKTTNFTGVLAKAIDAGYRLIIVLSGTTNLLRNQTQRRLDLELVGFENILRGAKDGETVHDYTGDLAWPKKVIAYGVRPSLVGRPDITRLTGLQRDFSAPDAGISPVEFEFEKKLKTKPLWFQENLDHAGARIAIIKKQKDRLDKLLGELRDVGAERCAEIPTLIIDDESDQASVDTLNPAKKKSADERSAINDRIVRLLACLPRAQYVGYTATPFANVFVSPDDPADIYPKDFIYSLNPPEGYMGARHFHDFGAPVAGMSNEAAHVRPITADDDRLEEALDAFVLTAALKVYREKDENTFPHHTMLVHYSPRTEDQKDSKERLLELWKSAGYDSHGPGVKRLKKLFESDFRVVWASRGKLEKLRFPASFDQLKKPLGVALERIRTGPCPVLMVNSAEGADVPDFKEPVQWSKGHPGVWKVIVGGAKLSRGYTVEGLTISHFQRPVRMQDALMQMGRWFGYRRGYRDLVRLYIGRAVPYGKGKELDLYKAFEYLCRDEESFREQLTMYEGGADGAPGLTPKDFPALVFNSHPKLRPTSPTKMFNAVLKYASFTQREPTSQASTGSGLKANESLVRGLLEKHGLKSGHATGAADVSFHWTTCSAASFLEMLKKFRWERGDDPLEAERTFLERADCGIDSWVVLLPQLKTTNGKSGTWKVGGRQFTCVARSMVSETRFGVVSTPEDVRLATWLVGQAKDGDEFACAALKPKASRGVMVLYPTRKKEVGKVKSTGTPTMGFFLTAPVPKSDKRVAFTVLNRSRSRDAIVDRSPILAAGGGKRSTKRRSGAREA